MKTTDGEILTIDQSERISFNLLRHHRSHAQASLFYTFEVIVCQGKSLVSTPLEKKQALLNYLFVDLGKNASPLCLSETIDATPPDLIRVAKEVGFVKETSPSAKRPSTNRANEFVIGGYAPDNPSDYRWLL